MDPSTMCVPIDLKCVKPPTAGDVEALKALEIVPADFLMRVLKGLNTDYKEIKKTSPGRSKSHRSTMRGGKKNGKKSRKMRTRKYRMSGGLSEYQKNRIVDMIIILVAGGVAYSGVVPAVFASLESYIVSIGILPKLCGQSVVEHAVSNMAGMFGSETCLARETRYNNVVVTIVSAVTASAWYTTSIFTRAGIKNHYNSLHKNVKKTIFGSDGALSPVHSPSRASPRRASPRRASPSRASPSGTRKRSASPPAAAAAAARSPSPADTKSKKPKGARP